MATPLLARPDEVMLEVGAGGELLVARLRAVDRRGLLLLLPLVNAAGGGSVRETMIGLGGAVFVNIFAQVWLALARRKPAAIAGCRSPPPPSTSPRPRWCWWCWPSTTCPSGAQQHGGVVRLPAGDRADRAAQRRSRHLVRRRAGARAVRDAGAGSCSRSRSSPEQLISTDYGAVTSAPGAATGAADVVTLITAMVVYRMQRLVEMSGTDGLTGPAQSHLAAAPRSRACSTSAPRERRQPVAGADRPRPLQAHQRRDRPPRRRSRAAARGDARCASRRAGRMAGAPRRRGIRAAAAQAARHRVGTRRRACAGRCRAPLRARARRRTDAADLQRRAGQLPAGGRGPVQPAAPRRPAPAGGQAPRPQPGGRARQPETTSRRCASVAAAWRDFDWLRRRLGIAARPAACRYPAAISHARHRGY